MDDLKKKLKDSKRRYLALVDECSRIADRLEVLHTVLYDKHSLCPISSSDKELGESVDIFVVDEIENLFHRIN